MKTFQNKVAAITGAGSGIGRALAEDLAAQGCELALSDVNEQGLAETVSALEGAADVKVTSRRVDVADRAAMHAWADEVARHHGRVNLIFNNAGVAVGSTIESVSYENFEWIMGINFWGVVHGTKAFLPHLTASGEGHVINVSSVFGLLSAPSQGTYNATKFAVRGFTEALRQELDAADNGVSATSVHPGGIKTNIAKSARFSDDVSELTGKDEADSKAALEKLFMTTPESAASTILRGVRRNARRVLVGPDAHALDLMTRLMPTSYQRLVSAGLKWSMR